MSDTSHDASDDAALPGTPEWWATRPTPTTQPRRGRPPRSFERIVATATKLVEEVGPDAFSMRTLAEFAKTWESQCPAIVKLWEASWAEFVPFLNFDPEIRTIICTTDAIESLNARFRRAVKARGHFPSEQAALKCLYLVIRSLDPTGRGRRRWTNRSQRLTLAVSTAGFVAGGSAGLGTRRSCR